MILKLILTDKKKISGEKQLEPKKKKRTQNATWYQFTDKDRRENMEKIVVSERNKAIRTETRAIGEKEK